MFCALDSFSTIPRASGLVFTFCAPGLVFTVPRASGPVSMFCAPGLVFGGTKGVGSRFLVLHSRTHFRRFRGRRVPFSCFAPTDSFSTVPKASGPVFTFSAPGLVFGGTEGVASRFHVLRARTRFQRYRGRRVTFSCFATLTRFRRYRGRRVSFSRFARPDLFSRYRGRRVSFPCFTRRGLFSAVPRASGPVFIFCAP
jgi:hypothetical protein